MRGIKKSRNGCATCKSKRLKCDESRPSCGRCTRLGVPCPGYSQPIRWVTKHEVLSTSSRKRSSLASKSPRDSLENNDQGSVMSDGVSPNILNGNDVSSPFPAFEEHAALTDLDQTLDFELLDHQFSMTLPELEHLDAPLATTMQQSSNPGRSPQESAILRGTSAATSSNRISSHADSSVSLFRPQGHFQAGRLGILPLPRRQLEDPSSTLVEYYFKEVAGLFSSYDSHMNPFRTTVSRLWASSPAMCRTLQSMAAATLVDDFPQFGPLGLKMRKEAISILEGQEVLDDKSLLAMLMLGQTASWHNPNDLGIPFFNTLRNHLNSPSAGAKGGSLLTNRNNYQFFEEALVYWEMLLSYVADHSTLAPSAKLDFQTASDRFITQQVPHPWTGIARDTQFIVHKVGRLVRRERKRIRTKRFTSQSDIAQAQEAIREARQLEERLLSLAHPTETEVVNPGDSDTPVWHLLSIAEVYRYTGLIQLYRVFPDLLRDRLQAESMSGRATSSGTIDPALLFASDNLTSSLLESGGLVGIGDSQHDDNGLDSISEDMQAEWLTTIALMAMSRLKTVPLESRTRCLQPFLLVASSSELRLPPMDAELPAMDSTGGDYSLNLSAHAIEVSRTRKFILGRLSSFLHVLPPKPIHICVEIVQEVWRRMDAGESDVYWMDVMIDHGWETTMG